MIDRYESTAAWLQQGRENSDKFRLRAGIRLARMERDTTYGAGVIRALAKDAGYHRSTLYQYAQVACFLVRWQGLSTAHTFDNHPMLTYTHYRMALKLDYESALDALLQAEEEGMTPDQFSYHVARAQGRAVNAPPLLDQEMPDHEVIPFLQRIWRGFSGIRVKVTIREVK